MPEQSVDTSEIAERLKDAASDHGFAALRATIYTGRDSWVHVEVRESSIWTDSNDGWDVEITRGSI